MGYVEDTFDPVEADEARWPECREIRERIREGKPLTWIQEATLDVAWAHRGPEFRRMAVPSKLSQ